MRRLEKSADDSADQLILDTLQACMKTVLGAFFGLTSQSFKFELTYVYLIPEHWDEWTENGNIKRMKELADAYTDVRDAGQTEDASAAKAKDLLTTWSAGMKASIDMVSGKGRCCSTLSPMGQCSIQG